MVDRVAVITGANSGIGQSVAIHLAEKGYRVYGTVRSISNATKLNALADARGVNVELVEIDVGSDGSVRDGFAKILDSEGRVDVLVNNAGVGGNGVVEECAPQVYLDVINVNLCGAVRCIQAVLPGMRERREGAIVNITSVAGRVAVLAQSPYVASKWAFEAVSEGLAQEVAAFGVRVIIIEPGVTKSSIYRKNTDTPNASGSYDDHYRRMLKFYSAALTHASDPFDVARLVYDALITDAPKTSVCM